MRGAGAILTAWVLFRCADPAPRPALRHDCLFVGDAPVEALRGEDAEFAIGEVKAARTLSRPRTFTCARPPTVFVQPNLRRCPSQPLADRLPALAATSLGTAVLRATPFLLTVPLIAMCGAIPRAFRPSTKPKRRSPCRRQRRCLEASRWLKAAAASHSPVPLAKVASAPATSPLRFSIGVYAIDSARRVAWPRRAVKARVVDRCRGVRRVRSFRLAEVDLSVAPRRRLARSFPGLRPRRSSDKLFIVAQAFNSVPSTAKCSALKSRFTSGRPEAKTRNPCANLVVTAVAVLKGRGVERLLTIVSPTNSETSCNQVGHAVSRVFVKSTRAGSPGCIATGASVSATSCCGGPRPDKPPGGPGCAPRVVKQRPTRPILAPHRSHPKSLAASLSKSDENDKNTQQIFGRPFQQPARTTKDKSRDLAVQDRKGPSSTRSAKRPTALAGNDLLITSERLLQLAIGDSK